MSEQKKHLAKDMGSIHFQPTIPYYPQLTARRDADLPNAEDFTAYVDW